MLPPQGQEVWLVGKSNPMQNRTTNFPPLNSTLGSSNMLVSERMNYISAKEQRTICEMDISTLNNYERALGKVLERESDWN